MSLAPLAPFCLPYFTQLSTLNISTSFVLFLADLLHPVDRFAVERLLNGDMSHRSGRRSAVPMLFTRHKPDHIARPDFLDRAAPTLNPPKAGREDQRLTEWMCMPGGAGPGSNVTLAQATRAGSGAWNKGSIWTVPVNQSAGPLFEGCDPLLLISIMIPFFALMHCPPWHRFTPQVRFNWRNHGGRCATNTSCREGRRIDREAAWEAASDRATTSQHAPVRVPRTAGQCELCP